MLFHILICVLLSTVCFDTTSSQFTEEVSRSTRYVSVRNGDGPPCILKPGETYCEGVPSYPYDVIQQALKNSKIDINKLLVDESLDDGPDFKSLNNGAIMGFFPNRENYGHIRNSRSDVANTQTIAKSNINRRVRRYFGIPYVL